MKFKVNGNFDLNFDKVIDVEPDSVREKHKDRIRDEDIPIEDEEVVRFELYEQFDNVRFTIKVDLGGWLGVGELEFNDCDFEVEPHVESPS